MSSRSNGDERQPLKAATGPAAGSSSATEASAATAEAAMYGGGRPQHSNELFADDQVRRTSRIHVNLRTT